jgi:hypothetical protein
MLSPYSGYLLANDYKWKMAEKQPISVSERNLTTTKFDSCT